MYLDDKLVLVAGSTGLAGSSIVEHIVGNCPNTRIRASYYRNTKPFIGDERVEHVYGDLRAQEDCRRIARGCDCAVMAAAYSAGAGQMVSQPWRYVNDNLLINSQLLEAFHAEGVKRLVYVGSATLYQEFNGQIREDQLDLNQDPHPAHFGIGWVLRFVEKLCGFWQGNSDMEILIARCSNIFGPFAKFDPGSSNFVPAIIRKAVDKMDPFEVWGSPDVTRDVIYSEDFARAIVMMLNNNEIRKGAFNIGSGVGTTVGEVVQWSLKYAGHSPVETTYVADMPSTIATRGLDTSKAREVLGWESKNTAEEGIRKTTEWWTENRSWWNK